MRKNARLAADDPYRLAIEASLLDHGDVAALEAWRQTEPVDHQHWIAWVIAVGVWWLLLLMASWLGITIARVIAHKAQELRNVRKARLRSQNRCLACGYDMKGLEFNEKCPECGQMVW